MLKLGQKLKSSVRNFWSDEKGISHTLEMSLLVAGVSIIVSVAIFGMSSHIGSVTEKADTSIDSGYTDVTSKVGGITIN